MGTYLHRGLENVKEEMWSNVQHVAIVACIQFMKIYSHPKVVMETGNRLSGIEVSYRINSWS